MTLATTLIAGLSALSTSVPAPSLVMPELALLLAKQQARLILVARKREALKAVKARCLAYTPFCEILQADVTNENQVNEAAAKAIALYGHIDVLVNQATDGS